MPDRNPTIQLPHIPCAGTLDRFLDCMASPSSGVGRGSWREPNVLPICINLSKIKSQKEVAKYQ